MLQAVSINKISQSVMSDHRVLCVTIGVWGVGVMCVWRRQDVMAYKEIYRRKNGRVAEKVDSKLRNDEEPSAETSSECKDGEQHQAQWW